MDKTSFKIFLVVIIFSLLIFCGLFAFSLYQNSLAEEKIEVEYVTNANIFFTVESCVNKYVGLIVAKDSTALYNVIDDKYKEDNRITISNVLANNIKLSGNYSFTAQKMLQDKKDKRTYYVKGNLIAESINAVEFTNEKIKYGLIVKLNVDNNTYSVIPSEVEVYFDEI